MTRPQPHCVAEWKVPGWNSTMECSLGIVRVQVCWQMGTTQAKAPGRVHGLPCGACTGCGAMMSMEGFQAGQQEAMDRLGQALQPRLRGSGMEVPAGWTPEPLPFTSAMCLLPQCFFPISGSVPSANPSLMNAHSLSPSPHSPALWDAQIPGSRIRLPSCQTGAHLAGCISSFLILGTRCISASWLQINKKSSKERTLALAVWLSG